jgi:hypothetical protein
MAYLFFRTMFCAACASLVGFILLAIGVQTVAILVVEYFGFMLWVTKEKRHAKQP